MRKHLSLSRARTSGHDKNKYKKETQLAAYLYWGQSSIPQNDLSNANKRNQITQDIDSALFSDETASSQIYTISKNKRGIELTHSLFVFWWLHLNKLHF
jgi:hypothetical protein